MARVKEYDRDVVLDRAVSVFWHKGYEATSMSELVDVTGLNSASMYKEFGNKAQLFEQTVEHYRKNAEASIIKPLIDNPCFDSILTFLNTVSITAQKVDFKGCLVMNSVSDMNVIDDASRKAVEKYCMRLEAVLENAIRVAQQNGDIPKKKDPIVLAHLIACFVQGMTAYGRLPDHKPYIPKLIVQLMEQIKQ